VKNKKAAASDQLAAAKSKKRYMSIPPSTSNFHPERNGNGKPSVLRLIAGKTPPRFTEAKHRLERAQKELSELVTDLEKRGVPTFEIFLALGRRNAQLGHPLPSVLPFIQSLPGLEKWEPLANWSRRLEGVTADGIPDPDFEQMKRRSRALNLAEWLRFWAGSLIAEEIVVASETIATRHAGEEVACG
jgi:hypothetical protein